MHATHLKQVTYSSHVFWSTSRMIVDRNIVNFILTHFIIGGFIVPTGALIAAEPYEKAAQ